MMVTMSGILCVITMFIMVVCFLRIRCLPVFDNHLFFLGSEIYRNSLCKCLIEFFDIVTSDIVFSSSDKVSLHNVRECLNKYLERFPIIRVMSPILVLSRVLDEFYYCSWSRCAREGKGLLSCKLDDNVGHADHRCEP